MMWENVVSDFNELHENWLKIGSNRQCIQLQKYNEYATSSILVEKILDSKLDLVLVFYL